MTKERELGLKSWLTGPGKKADRAEDKRETHVSLDRHRLAVLPFTTLSPDPNDEYFTDGMTEEIISTISKINELEVISRTSVMSYKKAPKPVKELSKELEVGTILEGSVRKSGNRLRITIQMIDALKDKHLWSNSYDRNVEDVFAIQTDIAERVAEALKLQLVLSEKRSIEKKPTESSEAYALYLKGRFFWNERSEKGVKEAIRFFEEAVRIDPGFAKAYSGLADCYLVLIDRGLVPPKKVLPIAKSYAEKALQYDTELAEGHASLGSLSLSDFDLDRAERELRRAIELNPNYSMAYHWLSNTLVDMRRYEEAYEMEKSALKLDPRLFILNLGMGIRLLLIGKTTQAIEQFDKALEAGPAAQAGPYFFKSIAMASVSKWPEAIEDAGKAVQAEGSALTKLNVAMMLALAGQPGKATEQLDKTLSEEGQAYVSLGQIAVVKMVTGRRDEGFTLLAKAYEERDPFLLYLRSFPPLHELWSGPRWVEIEEKAGFAQHH